MQRYRRLRITISQLAGGSGHYVLVRNIIKKHSREQNQLNPYRKSHCYRFYAFRNGIKKYHCYVNRMSLSKRTSAYNETSQTNVPKKSARKQTPILFFTRGIMHGLMKLCSECLTCPLLGRSWQACGT